MSSVWNSQVEGDNVKKVNVGTVIGPVFHSVLEASYARSVSANVISTGVGWDSLVVKHMAPGVELTGFGIVTANIAGEKSMKADNNAATTQVPHLCQMLQKFFS